MRRFGVRVVSVPGLLRSVGMRLVPVPGVISGVGVRDRMSFMRGVRDVMIRRLLCGRLYGSLFVSVRMTVGVAATTLRGVSRRFLMTGRRRRSRGMIVVTMPGFMAVVVVRLVFVAHLDPVPQPLFAVFQRQTGIT